MKFSVKILIGTAFISLVIIGFMIEEELTWQYGIWLIIDFWILCIALINQNDIIELRKEFIALIEGDKL